MTRTLLLSISFALLLVGCAQTQEAPGLSPIPGISKEKLSALNDAIAPLLKEQFLRTIPTGDLRTICSESELIAATFSDEPRLYIAAFNALRTLAPELTEDNVRQLMRHSLPGPEGVDSKARGATWRRMTTPWTPS